MPETFTHQYKVDSHIYTTTDAILSGRQIRAEAGLAPASNHVLIEVGNQTSRSVGLEETIDLQENTDLIFLSFKNDCTFSLTINERGYEWGSEEISAKDIRLYAQIPDDHELFLDSQGDKLIDRNGFVRLKRKGVERIVSREPEKICIYVNTREKFVPRGKLSFLEIVKLAFPETVAGPQISHTVGYYNGNGNAPEGTLVAGELVKVKKGMTFDVTQTDKS